MITQQERLNAFQRQQQRLQRRIERLDRRSNRYGWVRVCLFFGGLLAGLGVGFWVNWWAGAACFVLALLTFGIVAAVHQRIERSLLHHRVWLHLKETEVARMRLDWNSIPDAYAPEQQMGHPFEIDLDITGKHSLHRLLNTAISSEGTQRLRDWLLHTRPDLQVIARRRALIEELIPMSAFRTRLTMKASLAARQVSAQLEGQRLLHWLDAQKKPVSLWPFILFSHLLTVLLLLLLSLNLLGLLTQYWIIVLIVAILFLALSKERRGNLFDDAYSLRDSFARLNAVFSYLETYRYGRHCQLRKLCEPYLSASSRPSLLLRRIERIAAGATLERNGLAWLLVNLLFPWDFYLAQRFYRYRERVAAHLPGWLETWFELEALSSLATFAYLHPEYSPPVVYAADEREQRGLLCARGLGHPLLPGEARVVNDFVLPQGGIAILTGSNMAGKSTFLRTLGINLCLAYSGAYVNAMAFETALLRVFSCIKISDSVTEGYSYFYAEVRRLRALLDELGQPDLPLFFLIDEIFRGTNNRERRIGSEAYIRALAGQNCSGLLATHDLELVRLAEMLPRVQNYHFREEVIAGRMSFDYLLRPGPCPTTNALKIMQMEGLPVSISGEEA
ncbi:MAG TPA: MutS family DNA mismatch repair protein [Ktedonobacteraceae bacterium]